MTTAETPCPQCKKATTRSASKAYPFCSSRCQSVDLSEWLTDGYVISTPLFPHTLQIVSDTESAEDER